MRINGFTGVSLIDFPDKICSIIYTSPCNFRCPFCHNAALIEINEDVLDEKKVLSDILKRRNFIDAVTITGGEPTLQEDIDEFLFKIKQAGLPVKLDTNGYKPEKLKSLIQKKVIDYISMDIKSSPSKYNKACGIKINFNRIKESISIIKESGVDYNFRTTVVPGLIEEKDFYEIREFIKGAKLYMIQQFRNEIVFEKSYSNINPYEDFELEKFGGIMKNYVEEVKVINTDKIAE